MYENQRKEKMFLDLKIIELCDFVPDVPVADCGEAGFTWSDSLHNLNSDIIIVNIFRSKICLERENGKFFLVLRIRFLKLLQPRVPLCLTPLSEVKS